jgi:hypothetical protein
VKAKYNRERRNSSPDAGLGSCCTVGLEIAAAIVREDFSTPVRSILDSDYTWVVDIDLSK